MQHVLSPENKEALFLYVGLHVRVTDGPLSGATGTVTHLDTVNYRDPFFLIVTADAPNRDAFVTVKGDDDTHTYRVRANQLAADPRPCVPLDSKELEHGPYTMEEFLEGRVAVGDCGLLYGYWFWPLVFTGDPKGMMSTSSFDCHPGGKMRRFPMFNTREGAVEFLKGLGKYGEVMRYAGDRCLGLGKCRETVTGYMSVMYSPPYPWITAGVTDVVNAPPPGPGEEPAVHKTFWSSPTVHWAS